MPALVPKKRARGKRRAPWPMLLLALALVAGLVYYAPTLKRLTGHAPAPAAATAPSDTSTTETLPLPPPPAN
jgi:hypothetical protein